MAEERYSKEKLIVLRRLTRAIAELLRDQIRDYLSVLAPLLRPAVVLGGYVQGSSKAPSVAAEKAFQELQSLYAAVARAKPYGLVPELKPPLQIATTNLDLTPVEYTYKAKGDRVSKNLTVTSPLRWVVSYSDFSPQRLRQLLADPNRSDAETARFVLHYCLLHLVVARQSVISQMLDALRFDLYSTRIPEFGELPVTCIASDVPSTLPPDEAIIESTEISGRDVFEEIVDVDAVASLRDPFKDKLLELISSHGAA